MRLLAISDLHLNSPGNHSELAGLRPAVREDWLIVAGDLADSLDRLAEAFAALGRWYAKVIWVPGNHELWTPPRPPDQPRGLARYHALIDLARGFGITTPEDPFPVWTGAGGPLVIAPLCLLYDYSFRPDEVPAREVLAWAAAADIHPVDEVLLHPDPFPSRADWCAAQVRAARARLDALPSGTRTILVNHWPLRQEHAVLPRVPRFAPWCGTRATEDWHRRYRAQACIFGHLHIRGQALRDGVPFHEVSLGYPSQWDRAAGMAAYLRQILPAGG